MKKLFLPLIFILLFFIMLAGSASTFQGALNGLNLWLFTVLPSLLPYMIISSFMTESGTFQYLSRLLSPVTRHVFGLSKNCGYVILLGFLCGYPIGSKLSADMVKKNEISVREGQILLSFCNNVSPAFLITYLIDNIIRLPQYRTVLIAAMTAIPLLCGICFSRFSPKQHPGTPVLSDADTKKRSLEETSAQTAASSKKTGSIDICIINSFENCFKLGGYIILFSILSEFISALLTGMPELQCRICSILEITSGLNSYGQQTISEITRFTECTAFTAFGGLCCLAQTYSMIKGSGLSLKRYFLAKVLIASVTFFVCTLLFHFLN